MYSLMHDHMTQHDHVTQPTPHDNLDNSTDTLQHTIICPTHISPVHPPQSSHDTDRPVRVQLLDDPSELVKSLVEEGAVVPRLGDGVRRLPAVDPCNNTSHVTVRIHPSSSHHQRRGPKQNSSSHWTPRRPPDHSQTTKTEMVRPHNKINRACQDGHARYSPRREKTRQAEKEMGRQHPGMDGLDTGRRHEESRETRGVEGAGCQVICGAPTVH